MREGGTTRGADPGASSLSKAFTSWKFDLLDAMAEDPEVTPANFRIAYVVMQRVNQYTRMAEISDRRLAQLVKRDRSALTDFRRRLVALGWLEVLVGCYGRRATQYKFRDERATLLENIRLDEELLKREEEGNSEAESPHCMAPPSGVKTPYYRRATNEVKTPHSPMAEKPSHKRIQWGENTTHNGVKTQPIHLQTPRDSLPVKGRVSTHAHDAHVCAYVRWGEFNEVAGRLEYGEDLPRDVAEHLAHTQLGFDERGTNGRQGAGTAPPTVAKHNPDEGILDD
jgi:hypothetical protein